MTHARRHASTAIPQATLTRAITTRVRDIMRDNDNLGAPMDRPTSQLTICQVRFLADMYQRIADQRRIADISRRDDKVDFVSALATLIVVAIFFGMWFV